MIKSMTGFGRGELNTEIGQFTVEVKSVNSKSCTVIVRLPETLLSLESQISSYVKSRISRGQTNISVVFSRNASIPGQKVAVNKKLAGDYLQHLMEIKEQFALTDSINLSIIAALPGVVSVEEIQENIEEISPSILAALEMAMDQLIKMRTIEGAAILEDTHSRLDVMSEFVEQISERAPVVVEEYRQRLEQRLSEFLRDQVTLDESRIITEVAIMAERSDITEEIVRLRSHISQIDDSLQNRKSPVGRHLDFILQEVNREVNTISSKASDTQIVSYCIRLKDEIEKIREQVQNIE